MYIYCCSHGGVMGKPSEADLLEKLMTSYPKDHGFVRPVENSSQAVNVTLSLMLLQILTVNQVKQVMTVRAWTSMVSTRARPPGSSQSAAASYCVMANCKLFGYRNYACNNKSSLSKLFLRIPASNAPT